MKSLMEIYMKHRRMVRTLFMAAVVFHFLLARFFVLILATPPTAHTRTAEWRWQVTKESRQIN